MPIIGEQYVTPNWQNNSRPPINAEELLAIGAAIEGNPPLGAVIQVSYNEDEGGEGVMATYYKWRRRPLTYPVQKVNVGKDEIRLCGGEIGETITIYWGNWAWTDPNGGVHANKNGVYFSSSYKQTSYQISTTEQDIMAVIDFNNITNFNFSATTDYINDAPDGENNIVGIRDIYATNPPLYSICYKDNVENPGVYIIRTNPEFAPAEKFNYFTTEATPGTSEDYVYSTSPTAYPNGGEQNGYYYDQRTTVTSPTAPTGLTYPNPITTPTVTVSWNAATSNTDYPVRGYELTYAINGVSNRFYTTVTSGLTNSPKQVSIPATESGQPVESIMFRVRAVDANNQYGDYIQGTFSPIYYRAPTLTVPQQVMEGDPISVSWSNVGADTYTLQRKASTDTDWTTVYTGGNLSFSETVGTWTTVQYRVRGNTGSTPGPWATSPAIWVVGAGALVISGSDGNLGAVTNDIIFAVSTDTGNAITGSVTVNGTVTFSGTFANGQTQTIPVLDLPTGAGTIVIEASVQGTSGEVDQARTWTYTKTAITFPDGGAVALLQEHISGRTVFPETLAECVRLPGGKTLDEITAFPCQVYTGSYVGTGTYGQSNPNSLTFPFTPKLWGIYAVLENTSAPSFDPVPNIWDWVSRERVYSSYSGVGSGIISTEITGNSVSWYSSTNASVQLNDAGYTYYYFALGTATEPGVFLETPQYAESGSVVWNFSIPSGIEIPESGAVNVTVTMTRDGDTPTWTNGRHVTYAVDGADGSGTTAEALIRSSADAPAPTFTIQITNATQKAVYIRITNVSQ